MRNSCSEIIESLATLFRERVRVSTSTKYCTVTLPIRSADRQRITVFIEEKFNDFFLVHDGGKTESSLAANGINVLTEKRKGFQASIAEVYGVNYGERLIQTTCRHADLNQAILAVAQCSAMARAELLQHQPSDASDLDRFVAEAMRHPPPFVGSVEPNKKLHGNTFQHALNYVAHPSANAVGYRSTAVKILGSTNHLAQAKGFGFLVLDLRAKPTYHDWGLISVIPRVELWKRSSLGLVRTYSTKSIEIRTGEERFLLNEMPQALRETMLVAA